MKVLYSHDTSDPQPNILLFCTIHGVVHDTIHLVRAVKKSVWPRGVFILRRVTIVQLMIIYIIWCRMVGHAYTEPCRTS
jgi:hypothetical protein